jgi:hypothetical protein
MGASGLERICGEDAFPWGFSLCPDLKLLSQLKALTIPVPVPSFLDAIGD